MPNDRQVQSLVDSFFRHESGRAVASLTRTIGPGNLQLAEDSVQEAIYRALRLWPFNGIPDNPSAWIQLTARNVALDALRKNISLSNKAASIHAHDQGIHAVQAGKPGSTPPSIEDDVLRLIFVCCHPCVPEISRTLLALKSVCGFTTKELQNAFFLKEDAVLQRLSRARRSLAANAVQFDLPMGEELEPRLDPVLKTLYLLFNEGYYSQSGQCPIRTEMCAEAIRLTRILVASDISNSPQSQALLALMLFQASRLKARNKGHRANVTLESQNRSDWDHAMICEASHWLKTSSRGQEVSTYHLEASIAGCHCAAKEFGETNWEQICKFYDVLYCMNPSPVVGINRAVAVGRQSGPRAGLDALYKVTSFSGVRELESFNLVEQYLQAELKSEHAQKWVAGSLN